MKTIFANRFLWIVLLSLFAFTFAGCSTEPASSGSSQPSTVSNNSGEKGPDGRPQRKKLRGQGTIKMMGPDREEEKNRPTRTMTGTVDE